MCIKCTHIYISRSRLKHSGFFLPIGPICHWFKINNFTYMWVGYSKILSHEPQNLLFLTVQFFSSNFVLKPPMHALMSGKQPQHYGCIDNSPTGVKYIIVCICFCFFFILCLATDNFWMMYYCDIFSGFFFLTRFYIFHIFWKTCQYFVHSILFFKNRLKKIE